MRDARALRIMRFYELLADLEARVGGRRSLRDSDGRAGWPSRGVYFFFEEGEVRENGVSPRVVRVGTHALIGTSKSTLWGRLAQHRGSVGGTAPGGGNHRGSIFRLHVGGALLAREEWPEEVRATWGMGSSGDALTRIGEYPLEQAVSSYIGNMPFLWLEVDDAPGSASDRGLIERGSIRLLSNLGKPPIDPPSSGWLGRHAPSRLVQASGLWNVRHVDQQVDEEFLGTLGRWIDRVR